jgi:hypothetical protein
MGSTYQFLAMPKEFLEVSANISACADLVEMRDWVKQNLAISSTEVGNFWLPLVLTARGMLYGEAIAQLPDGNYQQPLHLSDALRQPLYQLGFRLLEHLAASPGVYLLQFGLNPEQQLHHVCELVTELLFDRLIPFPEVAAIAPANASVGIQEPDLFECHRRCLSHQPIHDLVIKSDRYLRLGADGEVVPG